MSILDEPIPLYKLYSLINVSLDELSRYEIYTGGINGNKLKLDSNGRCYTWFESNNPLYEDYFFQIPYGRPLNQSGNWQIIIKKKSVLDEPPNKGGSSRKRKNRIIRKSRKSRKSLHN